jgi:hypothetical protein
LPVRGKTAEAILGEVFVNSLSEIVYQRLRGVILPFSIRALGLPISHSRPKCRSVHAMRNLVILAPAAAGFEPGLPGDGVILIMPTPDGIGVGVHHRLSSESGTFSV